jgi:hypothetical protein
MGFAQKLLAVVCALLLVGFVGLDVLCVYQHWSIPLHHGRGADVWGGLLLFSMIGTVLNGTILLGLAGLLDD